MYWALAGGLLTFACCLGAPAYFFFQGVRQGIEQAAQNNAGIGGVREDSGEAAFNEANRLLGVNTGKTSFGNSEEARQRAADFSEKIRDLREVFFTKRKKEPLVSFSKGEFLTYCRLDETSCVFLVHVPDLRKFNNDAKNQLGELAWETAQLVVRTNGKSTPRKLAVGIRGVVLYDRAMIGSLQAADSPENGIEISKEGTLSQQAL
ncbi:MAG: hypothetical protein JSS02_35650, partial [Planctomycetes bacterium]|nr:hypothetical protein [Planctomycetota bacterium]